MLTVAADYERHSRMASLNAHAFTALQYYPEVGGAVTRSYSAGVGATLCTLPCVAWHFGQLSVVGIPAPSRIWPPARR